MWTITMSDDPDCNCYRATLSHGYVFDEGCHEFVSVYMDASERKQAIRDLLDRMTEATVLECTDPECDWCNEPDFQTPPTYCHNWLVWGDEKH